MPRLLILGLAGLFSLAAAPAQADVITGQWCAPGGERSLVVEPDNSAAFNGQPVDARITRHHIEFAMPTGEPDAGAIFVGNQLSDEQIRVSIGKQPAEIWTPCKPVS
jgi:hypothetical protein